jgi:hypothetical protein
VRKNKAAAVFAIICRSGDAWDPSFRALDFGETGETGMTFSRHPDRSKWEAANDGELGIYLLTENELDATGKKTRKLIVKNLSQNFLKPNTFIPLSGG